MDKIKNYLTLKKLCLKEGLDLFGVADISEIKNEFQISPKTLQNLDKAVCLALRLSQSILSEMEEKPTKLYFHHYKIINSFLDQAALKLGNIIQKKGYSALAIPATQIIDWEKNSAHLSHRRLGVMSGLGWIGRNNLLVNEKLGSQFRLVSILTDMPLSIDKPSREDCGDCRLCVRMCPAGAIQEDSSGFDHRKCFEKLRSFQTQRQVEQFVCGVCVNACRGKKR
ncbi:MAG: 4Fe-4S binding protein [Candidatus Omnitrophica bacterium]|nr:4Fe-4S binding protein [Candidatus Omnitrophota bacterium]MBU4303987.1 4Fe-4S binding protein [Candidatus Omnitrophota bacterium]MBU4419344.1 4Fe-4S binding protein [Candidatus Omnitrophota bacterium]MBU4467872.1 4Fe-4S binding protein [Candidatus Omnitrophota bacterium]MCG2707091.1 4Fe-4S binding protein [Candidatus Omnitrophota bacterium]